MALRYLYLVRHGQYNQVYEPDDRGGGLTDTGRQQADLVAEALKVFPLKSVYCSSMRRAFETAERIAIRHALAPHAFDLLREIMPSIPTGQESLFAARFPGLTHEQTARERESADKAFDRFFRPALDDDDEHDVLVCHGNIIRYFACRVLGSSTDLWIKMETHQCGITCCVVDGDNFRLASLNDTGHLPLNLRFLS